MTNTDANRQKQQFAAGFRLDRQDIDLIKLLFLPNAAEQAAALCRGLDFESASLERLLILARLGRESNFAGFPEKAIPRLQGILRYQSVQNGVLMQGMLSLSDVLRQIGCPVMLIKGAAMYAGYDRLQPRLMWDTDIAVPASFADRAIEAAIKAGFTAKARAPHSVNLINGMRDVDVHWDIMKHGGQPVSLLMWEHAQTVVFKEREFKLPSCADTLILLLDNEFRSRCIGEGSEKRLRWYCDCMRLLDPSFCGWDALLARTSELKAQLTVGMMLERLAESFPQAVPQAVLERLRSGFYPEPDYRQLNSIRSYILIHEAYERDSKSGAMEHRISRWLELMRTEYAYYRSPVSPLDRPVSLLRFLLLHWELDSLSELPSRLTQRFKSLISKGAAR